MSLPRQKLPIEKKTPAWRRKCVDELAEMSPLSDEAKAARDKAWDYYWGRLPKEDYTHVTSPYGKKRANMPAKLESYNIIYPQMNLLFGEKRKRPFPVSVNVLNPEAVNERNDQFMEMLTASLENELANQLAAEGLADPAPEGSLPPPEKVEEAFELSYRDQRAVAGQEALDFLRHDVRFSEVDIKGWRDWVVAGAEFTLNTVRHNRVIHEALPYDAVVHAPLGDLDFVEDAEWAVVRRLMSPARIVDLYHDQLSDDEIDRIEGGRPDGVSFFPDVTSGEADATERELEVVEVYWRSFKKVGHATWVDESGLYREEIVPEEYPLPKGAVVEWMWVCEVWEGHRIECQLPEDLTDKAIEDDGNPSYVYPRIEPHPVQRRDVDNPSHAKLPINGRSVPASLGMMGMAYQKLFNVYRYRLEVEVAKMRGKVSTIDLSMLPTTDGWDFDRVLYYIDALGILFTQTTENSQMNHHQRAILEIGLGMVRELLELIHSVRMEWMELTGISPQRLGSVSASELVGNTQQSIVQSSHITEDMFAMHEEIKVRDMQALLDCSKFAWENGKQASYVADDRSVKALLIDGTQHAETEYGIFVTQSGREKEILDVLQQLAQPMMQNGVGVSEIIEVLTATNLSQLKQRMQKVEKMQREMAEAEAKAMEAQAAAQAEVEQAKMDHEARENELDRTKDIEVALIQKEQDLAPNEERLEERKLQQADAHERSRQAIERTKIRTQARLDEKKIEASVKKQANTPSK